MLRTQDSSRLPYRISSGKDGPRKVQWRKLSRKRKLKITKRALKNLEASARTGKIDFGIDDYRHVTSLVYSQMPFNPNGHHCSCNCLDEIVQDPDLAIDGMNYGTLLKQLEEQADLRPSRLKTESSIDDVFSVTDSLPVSRDSNKTNKTIGLCHSSSCLHHRSSIASCVSGLSTASSGTCIRCKHCHRSKNELQLKHDAARRVSIAKDDGSIRSKIYGLKRELRHLADQIERNERMSIQSVVGRRHFAGEKEQLKALLLSDTLRSLKVKEMLYRSNNAELMQRLSDDAEQRNGKMIDDVFSTKNQAEGSDSYESSEEGVFDSKKIKLPRNSLWKGSFKENSRKLPALIEEDEEIRDNVSSVEWEESNIDRDRQSLGLQKANSYDILMINNDDYDEENESEDDDNLSKTWPSFQHRKLPLDFEEGSRRNSISSQETIVTMRDKEIDPVKRLVHRLDSGLTFGLSSPTREVMDEFLIDAKEKIDVAKLSGSRLSEDRYFKPLSERQTSFGSKIRQTIHDEIIRRGSLVNNGNSELVEEGLPEALLNQEVTRRRSLVVDEKNIEEFIGEAEAKSKILSKFVHNSDAGTSLQTDDDADAEAVSNGSHLDKSHVNSPNTNNESGLNGKGNMPEETNKVNSSVDVAEIGGKARVVPRKKIFDLSTLRTVAQKHQTLRTLARLDEDLYEVSDGIEKLNAYRKKEAKENVVKRRVDSTPIADDDLIALTKRERKFSIPEPMNTIPHIDVNMAENEKMISKLNFKYDMIRDLRFLIMNQSTSREFSYSYMKPAPPYLKTKWENRVKRGFMRGVKEDRINEGHLEKVEDVTLNLINRDAIHSETLKKEKRKKRRSSEGSRKSLESLPKTANKQRPYGLPPLQLPRSRTPSPNELIYWKNTNSLRSKSLGAENLQKAFARLSDRHKHAEKNDLMRDVVKLSTNERNRESVQSMSGRKLLSSSRSNNSDDNEERYVPKLNTNRRNSSYVQNFVMSDPVSGRISVSSDDIKRRMSII